MTDPKLYQNIVYRIIGAAMTVQDELNWGLAEAFYTEALHIELQDCGIENRMEVQVPCYYKGKLMEKYYHHNNIHDHYMSPFVVIRCKKSLMLT